jgi:hypothetical protein
MIASFFVVLLVARFVFHRDLGTGALQALTIGGPAVPFVGTPNWPTTVQFFCNERVHGNCTVKS